MSGPCSSYAIEGDPTSGPCQHGGGLLSWDDDRQEEIDHCPCHSGQRGEILRYKAIVRRRVPEDDEGLLPEDVWPEHFTWIVDEEYTDCATGRFHSGCMSPFPSFNSALAEAIARADKNAREWAEL